MANDVSPSFPEYWSRRMQRKHNKTDRYRAIVSMEETGTLKRGDKVHRPYRSAFQVNDLGSTGSYTRQDIEDTDDSLTIDQEKEVSFYIREIDEIQSNYKTRNLYADDAAIKLSNQIDGQVFGEYDQATSTVDDGDLGGTDGNGFTISQNNVLQVFTVAGRKLTALDVDEDKRIAFISPEFREKLILYLGGKESALGDKSGVRGHIGHYMGFDLYLTTALAWSGRLEFGTLPTDGETIVINGVTLTFKDSIGTAAGNVHIGASTAAVALDILVASINAPGTSVAEGAAAGFVALSAANQRLLNNVVATDEGTYMTLKVTGKSYIAVSETLSAVADIWTTTKQIQHNLFGRKGAIDLVIQKYPNMKIKDRDGYIGVDVVTWTVFGIETFEEGKDELVDVQIRSDAF